MQELKEVIEHLGYDAAYEEKAYPRDLTQFGRFRVLLKDPQTGEAKVEGITKRARRAPRLHGLATRVRPDPMRLSFTRARALSLGPFAGKELLLRISELIPNLKSRKEGKAAKPGVPGIALPGYPETLMPIAASAAPQLPGMPGGGASASGGGSSKKKKGK
jgi:hypothetical protein